MYFTALLGLLSLSPSGSNDCRNYMRRVSNKLVLLRGFCYLKQARRQGGFEGVRSNPLLASKDIYTLLNCTLKCPTVGKWYSLAAIENHRCPTKSGRRFVPRGLARTRAHKTVYAAAMKRRARKYVRK